MRSLALLAVCALVGCSASNRELETHMAMLDTHIDRNTEAVETLSKQLSNMRAGPPPTTESAPKPIGLVCRPSENPPLVPVVHLAAGDRNLGFVEKCPAPRDYAQCIAGQPVSDIAAACAAGKLDALLDGAKTTEKKTDKKS